MKQTPLKLDEALGKLTDAEEASKNEHADTEHLGRALKAAKDSQEQLEKASATKTRLTNALTVLEEQEQLSKKENRRLQAALDESMSRCQKVALEKETLKTRLSSATKEKESFQTKFDSLSTVNKQLAANNRYLVQKIEAAEIDLKQTKQRIEDDMNIIHHQVETLRSQNSSYKVLQCSLESEIQRRKERLEETNNELSKGQESLLRLESELFAAKKTSDALSGDLEEEKTRCQKVAEYLAIERENHAKSVREASALHDADDSKIVDLNNDLKDAHVKIENMQQSLDNTNLKADDLEGALKQTHSTLAGRQRDLETANSTIKQLDEDLERAFQRELEYDHGRLSKRLDETEAGRRDDKERMDRELGDISKRLDEAEAGRRDDKERMDRGLGDITRALEAERSTSKILQGQVASHKVSIANYETTLQQERVNLSGANQKILELQQSGSHDTCVFHEDVTTLISDYRWVKDAFDQRVKGDGGSYNIFRVPGSYYTRWDGRKGINVHTESWNYRGY